LPPAGKNLVSSIPPADGCCLTRDATAGFHPSSIGDRDAFAGWSFVAEHVIMADPPPPKSPYSSPVEAAAPGVTADATTDATGGVIPYKNPKALIAYYLGVF